MENKIEVWCTLFSCGECKIIVEKEDGEEIARYTHVQNDPISAKQIYNELGKIPGSYKGICKVVREIQEREGTFYRANKAAYTRYYGRKEADKMFGK